MLFLRQKEIKIKFYRAGFDGKQSKVDKTFLVLEREAESEHGEQEGRQQGPVGWRWAWQGGGGRMNE